MDLVSVPSARTLPMPHSTMTHKTVLGPFLRVAWQ